MSPFQTHLQNAKETLESLASFEPLVNEVVDAIVECLVNGHKLLLCGNGGSASDSAHIATEFTCRFKGDRRPYPALALAVDGALLTAISNDYAFQDVFGRQVRAFGAPGDILIVLTTSGKSRNLLYAIEEARNHNMKTIAFLGKGGGFTAGAANWEFVIEGTETARIQEAHKFLLHVICDLVDARLPKE